MKAIILGFLIVMGTVDVGYATTAQDSSIAGADSCGPEGGCQLDDNNNGLPDCNEGFMVVDASRRTRAFTEEIGAPSGVRVDDSR